MKHKRADSTRVYNTLDSRGEPGDLGGFWFILQPTRDPVAWDALQHYASITPNRAQSQALTMWLRQHSNPAAPVAEQMELL